MINTDPRMLQVILRNLCSNSLKFTNPDGVIIISAEQKDEILEISVIDNGVGIPENKISGIFDESKLSRTTPGTNGEMGTGLGLLFCKDLIKKMGGTINVKSEGVGKGTTFTITLPK